MKNLFLKHYTFLFIILVASVAFSSCNGGNSAVDETWSLVELVTVGDPIENSSSEIIEVKNCGIPVEKSTECSAGTSKELNATVTGGGAFGVGSQFTFEGSVGTTLGIGQQSGETVTLSTPPDGLIYTYVVNKLYRVVTGQALAKSSHGNEQVVNFTFQASCTIDIVSREQTNCSDVASTSTPSSNLPVEINDGFDNGTYDGKWNDTIWVEFGDVIQIYQQDGVLFISRDADSFGGIVANQRRWLLSEINFVESRIMLSDDIQTRDGDIGVEINTRINGNWWFAKCAIHGEQSDSQALILCDTADGFSITPDEQYAGEYIPQNLSEFTKANFSLSLNSWSSSGGFISGFFDYVRLKTK